MKPSPVLVMVTQACHHIDHGIDKYMGWYTDETQLNRRVRAYLLHNLRQKVAWQGDL